MVVLLVALALGLGVAVVALGREIRLRRMLEKLLHLVLQSWRADESPSKPHDNDRGNRSRNRD